MDCAVIPGPDLGNPFSAFRPNPDPTPPRPREVKRRREEADSMVTDFE